MNTSRLCYSRLTRAWVDIFNEHLGDVLFQASYQDIPSYSGVYLEAALLLTSYQDVPCYLMLYTL